jgi:hypothetical protein
MSKTADFGQKTQGILGIKSTIQQIGSLRIGIMYRQKTTNILLNIFFLQLISNNNF